MASRWAKVFILLIGALGIGLLLSTELYFTSRAAMTSLGKEPSIDLYEVALPQFVRAFMWAAQAPFIRMLWQRIPLRRGRWAGGLSYHLGMSIVVMATYYLGRMGGYYLFWEEYRSQNFWELAWKSFYGRNLIDLVYYWAVIGISSGLEWRERYAREALRTAQLEGRLVEAELRALKQQLNPHFLFNTMNTIAVLVREQRNDEAVTLIARVSTLLRTTLEHTGVKTVTLRQELDFLSQYLEVQKARFGDKLTYCPEVQPCALEAVIPNLILQPCVENAILHGIAPKTLPGRLTIRAGVRRHRLEVEVEDDGPGFAMAVDGAPKEGVGLTNTRERLARHYGPEAQMVIRSERGRGVTVRFTLPFLTSPPESAPP